MTPPPNTPKPNAFTLIEVLIASLILALGTLGLLVLFAGAAAQQRSASEATTSLFAARSADAFLAERFEALAAEPPDALDPISTGVWLPIPVVQSGDRQGIASVDPNQTGEIFFVVREREETTLYDPNIDNETLLAGAGSYAESGAVYGGASSDSTVFSPRSSSGGSLLPLAHNRIDNPLDGPPSLDTIYVVTDDAVTNPTPSGQSRPRPYINVPRNITPPQPFLPNFPGSVNGWTPNGPDTGLELYTPDGQVPDVADPDFILLDLNPLGGITPDDEPARIVAFNIRPVETNTNRIVRRIYAPPYTYRTDEAVSLNNRIVTNASGDPRMAYSIFYRESEETGAQLAVFTYFIRGAREGVPFEPDESTVGEPPRPNNEAPVQLVDLTLGWDDDAAQYYLSLPASSRDAYALNQGQLILIADGPTTALTNQNLAGSDIAVTVVGTREFGNEIRGLLDRVPRASAVPMLETRTAARQTVQALVVKDIITDRNDNRFQLQPRDVRIYQLQ